ATVVVTFDDGYSDNLHTALPLLERFAVPATVFVVSGRLGTEPWWDRLARLRDGDAPRAVQALAASLEQLSEPAREARLREYHAGCTDGTALYRTMTAAELRELADSGMIEIGSHGVSHRPLSALSGPELAAETFGSKEEL